MTATQEQPSAKSWSVAQRLVGGNVGGGTSRRRQRRRRGCRRRRSRSRRTRSRWRSSGRVVAVSVATFLLEVSPVAAPTISRTMKARTTHETICPHNGQPRKRRHGFRELEDPPALPPAGFGGGPGGAHLLSGGYHFPSEACHQPSPWEMSLTGHHPPCGSFRPPQGVGIALNVDPGPDRRNNDGPLRRQPLPHGATWPTSNRLPISIDSAPSVVASGTELACLVTLVGARRRIAASRSGCWGCGRRCCGAVASARQEQP